MQPSVLAALAFTLDQPQHHANASKPPTYIVPPLLFDIVLGLLGLTATLTAASDFSSHRKIRNPASGALDEKATVTRDEMLEHAFYQVWHP
jgi:hypothetical protein